MYWSIAPSIKNFHIKSHKLMDILWAHMGVIGCIRLSGSLWQAWHLNDSDQTGRAPNIRSSCHHTSRITQGKGWTRGQGGEMDLGQFPWHQLSILYAGSRVLHLWTGLLWLTGMESTWVCGGALTLATGRCLRQPLVFRQPPNESTFLSVPLR